MMRVTTLKVAPDGSPGPVAYYTGLAHDQQRRDGAARGPVDYYLDRDEPPGRWWGQGRSAFALEGSVEPEQLEALLNARGPVTGRRLGLGFGRKSARGFDATFSAPKSVSVLWATSEDVFVQAELLAAHDAAVTATLRWFETHGAVTRRGKKGVHQVDTRGLIVALFRQHTSRTTDPQLHTHAVIAAKVQDGTGKWLSLDARFLKHQQRAMSYLYASALRTEVTNRLGLEWRPVVNGHAELDAIPASVLDAFSQRTAQVEEKTAELVRRWSAENGGAEPNARTAATLQRRAVTSTRPRKEHAIDADELHREWRRQVVALGFDPVSAFARRGLPGHAAIRRETLVAEALERVAATGSTWLHADVARELAAMLPADAAGGASDLVRLTDELAAEAIERCVALHPPTSPHAARRRDGAAITEHVTDRRYTTSAVLDQEARLLRWARAGVDPAGGARSGQEPAAAAIAGEDRLVLVVGPAGTGKTTTVATGVARLRAQRRPVVGLAPSGKAADVLAREAGCPAATLAKLLYEHTRTEGPTRDWRLPVGTTVVLDEAGMTFTDDLSALVTLAERYGWRLVCVGDPDQLPAVGRGGMFTHWCDTLPTHQLGEVHRFVEAWERDASLLLRRGEPDAAAQYRDHLRIRTAHPALLSERVAGFYQHPAAQGRIVAVTTSSASTARAINLEIQRARNPQHLGRSVSLADGTSVFEGDTIATRRNDPRLQTTAGHGVRNRHTWTVSHIGERGDVTVQSAERGSVTLPRAYVARHVELGWAVTGYGTQGDTVDHGICVIEPPSTRAGIYVGMTRGRRTNHAVIVDSTGLADPQELLAAAISKPANAKTAHAVRDELYRAHGQAVPTTIEPKAAHRMREQPKELQQRPATRRRLSR
jgi:conjugative relaxase-like TrwC/TraI family protein